MEVIDHGKKRCVSDSSDLSGRRRDIGGVLPDGDAGLEYQHQYHDNGAGVCGFEREDETHRGTGSICKPAAA